MIPLTKREAFEALFNSGRHVALFVQAGDCAGLPAELKGETRLDVGQNLRLPTPCETTQEGIRLRLSFGGVGRRVWIPWAALEGLVDVEAALTAKAFGERPAREGAPSNLKSNLIQVDFTAKRKVTK